MPSDAAAPWAADALLSGGEEAAPGLIVREVTAGILIVLERIGSPYATGEAPAPGAGFAPWLGTVYAMTRPAAESWGAIRRGTFEAEAAAWADTLSPAAFDAALGATARAAGRMRAASLAGGDGSGEGPGAGPPPAATAG